MFNLNAVVNEALWAGKLGFVLDLDENEKVQVVPHVVLDFNMLIEWNGLVIEFWPVEAAYEACVFEGVVFFLLLLSQIAESVDDHTKNEIQCDNDDDEEEEQIVDYSEHVQRFLLTKRT